VASDIAGQTTHYNLVLALIGFAIGIGATVSTTVGGMIADQIGQSHAILVLAASALASTVMAAGIMPETAPVQVAA
jgi:predicted MFS family arabinose efflux permease